MAGESKTSHRLTVRLDEDTNVALKYWAEKKGVSVNAYVIDAIELAIAHANKDYDIPTAEIARLNQIVDAVTLLSSNVKTLEDVVITSNKSIMNIARGENYLLDGDDDNDIY